MTKNYNIYDSEIKAIQKIIAVIEGQGKHLRNYERSGYEGGILEFWVEHVSEGWDIEETYSMPYKNIYKKDFEFSFDECELFRVQRNKLDKVVA